ncbi:MAG: hypothetical protein IJT54_08250 [Candidatus Methanomethylophilaceae archaeon]|nr:hypothetical protein [Candidatus Methanomethylophilaceae archaeon]
MIRSVVSVICGTGHGVSVVSGSAFSSRGAETETTAAQAIMKVIVTVAVMILSVFIPKVSACK